MYGVGQTSSRRRGLVVIIGVLFLALILVGVFYAFYTLVLNSDDEASTPAPEATTTVAVAASTQRPTLTTVAMDTATARPATPTLIPTTLPTDTPRPTATLRPPPEVITIGVRARVNISEGLGLNLRDLPSLSGSTVITQLLPASEVDVVEGPEEEEDLRWWNVNGGEGRVGWVVESFGGETWLVPIGWTDEFPPLSAPAPTATPTLPPATATAVVTPTATPTLEPTATGEITPTATVVLTPTATPEGGIPSPTVGGRAQVTTKYQFVNLRQAPGLDAEAIAQLANGTTVTILEGPEEADALRWWRVDDGQGNIGWAAERVGGEVLLVPIP